LEEYKSTRKTCSYLGSE